MARKDLDEFAHELGGEAPAALTALSAAEVAELTRLLRAARQEQKRQIRLAFDRALSQVPFLLRGPLRKMLGGD